MTDLPPFIDKCAGYVRDFYHRGRLKVAGRSKKFIINTYKCYAKGTLSDKHEEVKIFKSVSFCSPTCILNDRKDLKSFGALCFNGT